jgi:hypothetical protein
VANAISRGNLAMTKPAIVFLCFDAQPRFSFVHFYTAQRCAAR